MRNAWKSHPNLLSWAGLALGMVIIVVFSARNVGFQPAQWAAILVATIILAGLCVWIVSWEDRADDQTSEAASSRLEHETDGRTAGADIASTEAVEAVRNGDL